jgi:hypothetical protein
LTECERAQAVWSSRPGSAVPGQGDPVLLGRVAVVLGLLAPHGRLAALRSILVAISVGVGSGEAYYLPLRHRSFQPAQGDLLLGDTAETDAEPGSDADEANEARSKQPRAKRPKAAKAAKKRKPEPAGEEAY